MTMEELLDYKRGVELRNFLNVTFGNPKFRVEKIIRNGPATIVVWDDRTKTIVKKSEDAPDDMYYAFTAAFAKKYFGSNSQIRKILKEKTVWQPRKDSKIK